RWFAAVTREGQSLRFGDAGATRMMCAEPAMAAEQRFLAALQATRGFRMEGEELVLTDQAGREAARFQRER
ncbi:MAG TPA: META domain-containing protein, partial [Terricaulis sp.]|nr:META domain-containing protein [Terricaulis sp.]